MAITISFGLSSLHSDMTMKSKGKRKYSNFHDIRQRGNPSIHLAWLHCKEKEEDSVLWKGKHIDLWSIPLSINLDQTRVLKWSAPGEDRRSGSGNQLTY